MAPAHQHAPHDVGILTYCVPHHDWDWFVVGRGWIRKGECYLAIWKIVMKFVMIMIVTLSRVYLLDKVPNLSVPNIRSVHAE